MSMSHRALAKSWPYTRHKAFEEPLRHTAAAWFKAKGSKVHVRYPYILSAWANWPENIVCPEVTTYIKDLDTGASITGKRFPLHKYLHHGLSSQAMLFNLIGPLAVHGDLSPLRNAFAGAGISWPGDDAYAEFELSDSKVFNEVGGQPTSIDLAITGGTGVPLYIEAKFVEREFGNCSVFEDGDCDGANPAHNRSLCYLAHIGRRYWDVMDKHGFLIGDLGTSPFCPLMGYYQFFRELLFAVEKGGLFVLLYDARNPTFVRKGPSESRGLLPFLTALVPEPLRDRVRAVSIQEIFAAIVASGQHKDWVGTFAQKYALSL
jgi:hypothetical protein